MKIVKASLTVLSGLAFGASFGLPPLVFGQASFYQGKTITIVQARRQGARETCA